MAPYTTKQQFEAKFGKAPKHMILNGVKYDVAEYGFSDEHDNIEYKLVNFEKVGEGIKMHVEFVTVEY